MRLSVPASAAGTLWGSIRGEFERQLAGQESARGHLARGQRGPPGRDYVRVVIMATVDAADVAEAPGLAWWTVQKAARRTSPGRTWPSLRPRYGQKQVSAAGLLRGDQRGDDAPVARREQM